MDEDLKKIYDEKDYYVIYYEKDWNLKINVGKIRKVVKKIEFSQLIMVED